MIASIELWSRVVATPFGGAGADAKLVTTLNSPVFGLRVSKMVVSD